MISKSEKLNYILETYIVASDVTRAFGFKSNTMISNMRKGQANIATLHMEGFEKNFDIPIEIFLPTVDTKEKIDKLIAQYKFQKLQDGIKAHHFTTILQQLEQNGLIPKNIFDQEREALDKLIKKHKEALENQNSNSPCMQHSKKVFQKNDRLFQKLKGVWYAYFYPSNPTSTQEGIWEIETTIHDDYSVVDQYGNRGYLKIGKHQSMIIAESHNNDDLIIIRFANQQIPFEYFHFVLIANQNNTSNEMICFGFYSHKKHSSTEAKELLGAIDKAQLKLDLDFDIRLSKYDFLAC